MMEGSATAAPARRPHDAPDDGASAFSTPSGAPDESPAARTLRLLLAVSLAAGALLRILQYASARALWLDEAVLAASVVERGFAGLVRPLEYGQTAPLGFLLLQKTAVALLGAGEHALRLFPFLAGMAALALFAARARRWTTSPGGAALAVALFALAPFLVYYSAEAKPYAFDVLAAVAVLACAAPFVDGTPARRDAVLLLAVSVAGVWLSQPVVFVLAGVGLPLFVRALRAGDRTAVRTLAGIGAAWVVSFAASYAFQRSMLADAEYIRDFWRSGFPPLPPRTAAEWAWLPQAFVRLFREPLGVYGEDASLLTRMQTAVGLVAFVAGCVSLWRRDRVRLAVLVLPIFLVLAAATPRLYPFGGDYPTAGRVLLFLLPALLLVIGEGVSWAARGMARAGRPIAIVAAALLVLPSLGYAALAVPHMRAEMKPLLQYAAENRQPGDVLYVHYRALPAFDYYAARYGWTGAAVARGACARREPARYMDDLARLRGRERAWVLFVDGRATENFDERTFMTSFLDHLGARRDAQVSAGAWLYLYDLRPQNGRPGPFRARVSAAPPADDASYDCRGPWAPR